MKSRSTKHIRNLSSMAFVGTLTTCLLCLGALNLLNFWNPKSDVVGGSALFRTNTVLYTVLVVLIFLSGSIYALFKYQQPNHQKRIEFFQNANQKITNVVRYAKKRLLLSLALLLLISKTFSFILFAVTSPINITSEQGLYLISSPLFLALLIVTIGCVYQVFRNRNNGSEFVLSYLLLTSLVFLVPLVLIYNMYQNRQETPLRFLALFTLLQMINLLGTGYKKFRIRTDYASVIVIFYLLSFSIPGTLQSLNYFEDYPYLNVHAFHSWGYLPWKDLQLNHGLYSDFIRQFFGFFFIDNTAWGVKAGIDSFLFPLEIVIAVVLLGLIFSNIYKISIITIVGFSFINFSFNDSQNTWFLVSSLPRALPLLISTLVLKKYLVAATPKNWINLIFCGTLAILWSAEGISNVAGISAALAVNILINRKSLTSRKIFEFISITIFPFVLAHLILKPLGLSQSFFGDFDGMTGNILQGNLPFNFRTGLLYSLLIFLIPVVISFSGYRYVQSILWHQSNPNIFLVPSLFAGAYFYIKFLAWPDLHIQQSSNSMSVVWFFIGLALYKYLRKYGNAKAIVMFIVIAFVLQNSLPSRALTPKYEGIENAQLGNIGPVLANRVAEMEELKKHLIYITQKQNLRILDFTNAPIEINYLTDSRFVPDLSFTSFYVSYSQQLKAVSSIRSYPPDVVIWEGPIGYSNGVFPGEMYVRNYLIAKEILEKYQTIEKFGRYTILLPGSKKNVLNASGELVRNTCDWGLALEKFTKVSVLAGINRSYLERSSTSQYVFSKPISSSQILGFYVKVKVPGTYDISVAKSDITVRFEVSETQNIIGDNKEMFVPVSSCPSWRLSQMQVSSLNTNTDALQIVSASQ